MTGLIGKGDGCTLLVLTDAESRAFRAYLESMAKAETSPKSEFAAAALGVFNAGIKRGTAKLQEEAAANQKAKREGKSK